MSDKNKIAVKLFDKYAQQYQDKYMDLALYHNSFDLFCQYLKKENAKVLEIACGPGNITQYLLSKRPDLKILATDLSPKMLELAKVNNPSATFQLMDGRKIGTLQKKYDGIICGFCLPYLSKEEALQLIEDAAELLVPKGVFYISTMEDDYSKSDYKGSSSDPEDKIFMHYHQADYLVEGLKENGFKNIHLDRKEYVGQDGSDTVDLLLIAVNG